MKSYKVSLKKNTEPKAANWNVSWGMIFMTRVRLNGAVRPSLSSPAADTGW